MSEAIKTKVQIVIGAVTITVETNADDATHVVLPSSMLVPVGSDVRFELVNGELRQNPLVALDGLTSKQVTVFKNIEAIGVGHARARDRAQALLWGLEGEPLTKTFVRALQQIMKARSWGTRCKCGAEAFFSWRRLPRIPAGGNLVFTHTDDSGKHVTHSGMTRIPKIVLIDKADLRRRKRRTSGVDS